MAASANCLNLIVLACLLLPAKPVTVKALALEQIADRKPLGSAQNLLTLEQITARKQPDLAPTYEGDVVSVKGIVSAKPIDMTYFSHLPIQDGTHGVVLEGLPSRFSNLNPGDTVEVLGTVSKRSGLPVLLPAEIRVTARGPAPSPQWVEVEDLESFRYLGVLVATEGRVVEVGRNASGEHLVLSGRETGLKVFLPLSARGHEPKFATLRVGDKVRAVGFASQDCPNPPYDHFFQLVVSDPNGVTLVSRRWLIRPELFGAALVALAFAVGLWWARGRRMAAQRNIIKTLYSLGEDIIGAPSPAEILNQIQAVLPPLLKVSGIRLYLFNKAGRSLDEVQLEDRKAITIPLDSPEGLIPSGAAACFRNQALLTIPDTRRSPFLKSSDDTVPVRSVMFVPMMAEAELLGVLEIHDSARVHNFSLDEQMLSQHLGNQVAIALRLMQEQTIRDQLWRSEKLAAAGQLLSGVTSELRAPLETICRLTDSLETRNYPLDAAAGLQAIASEAEKASSIVSRLVSFSQSGPAEAKPVELRSLIQLLMEFRHQQWVSRGFEVQDQTGHDPVFVLGSFGQLERVFLNLLVHAEQSVSESLDKRLAIALSVLGKKALVEITYSSPIKGVRGSAEDQSETGLLIEGVTRGIIQSHGGETRLVRLNATSLRMEVELPVASERTVSPGTAENASPPRLSTVLLVEPDSGSRKSLLSHLGKRGYRVVPAESAEEGTDLAQRLHFDLVFCSITLPGLNWLGFFTNIRREIGAFVLLAEVLHPELTRGFQKGELNLLQKPVAEAELDRMLHELEASVEPVPR